MASETQELRVDDQTMSKAMKVGPRATIIDIRLIDHRATLRGVKSSPPELMRVARAHETRREKEPDLLRVTVALTLDAAYDNEESKNNPTLTIQATYGILYKVVDLEKLSDDELGAFAEVNGSFNVWPFWRELCHSAMGRMGIEPSTIPTLRVVK